MTDADERDKTATEEDSPTATAEDIAEMMGANPDDVRDWVEKYGDEKFTVITSDEDDE